MCKYDDKTLEPIPPTLELGEKEHVVLTQDETNVTTNDSPWHAWLKVINSLWKRKETDEVSTLLIGFVRQLVGSHFLLSRLRLNCCCWNTPTCESLMLAKSSTPGKTMMHGGILISFMIKQQMQLIFLNACIWAKWLSGFLIAPQPTKVWQLMHWMSIIWMLILEENKGTCAAPSCQSTTLHLNLVALTHEAWCRTWSILMTTPIQSYRAKPMGWRLCFKNECLYGMSCQRDVKGR